MITSKHNSNKIQEDYNYEKQLLTGALALSLLMGTTGMAFAYDVPVTEMICEFTTTNADSTKLPDASNPFKLSEMKAYTTDTYAAEIARTKAGLLALVKNELMTREEAIERINQMEETLQRIKENKLTIYYADMLDEDGNIVGFVTSTETK